MANALITKDQTPTLDFADVASALEYWVQIAADRRFSTISSQAAGLATSTYTPASNLTNGQKYYWRYRARTSATLSTDQSNTTGGGAGHALRDAAARTVLAQTFLPDKDLPVKRVILSLKKTAAPTGNIWVEIWTTSGGTPSAQTGTDSATVSVATIGTGAFENVNFDFTTPIPLAAGTTYAIVLFGDFAIDGTNYASWEHDGAGSYSDGAAYKQDGSTFSANGSNDHIFTTQTHTWLAWRPVNSFWLDTAAEVAVTPTTWMLVDPDTTTDSYAFDAVPRYRITPTRIRRGVERNLSGKLLSEYVATMDTIELDFERAQPKYDQVAETLRFAEKRKAIFLMALIDYEDDTQELIWKCEFAEDPAFEPLAEGRQDYYRGSAVFEEAALS